MTRGLVFVHRWIGIGFGLLFAMWFASGIVMHFVPFPGLTEAERFAGLGPIAWDQVAHGPTEAVRASGIANVTRVRLLQRSDGPIYVVSAVGAKALHATDLSSAALRGGPTALAIAIAHAHLRGIDPAHGPSADLLTVDQWSLSNRFDGDRPLYRVSINDAASTDLYVSSSTGEVVLDTSRSERWWNYVGSVAHWIYPTALRRHVDLWEAVVWWLSLVALTGASLGIWLGITRMSLRTPMSPYQGWHAWHHGLGLLTMTFVLSWILSGWLSLDNGRLFSTTNPSRDDAASVSGVPAWDALSSNLQPVDPQVREIEWFGFDGTIYRRDRSAVQRQSLTVADANASASARAFLAAEQVGSVAPHLAPGCGPPLVVEADDDYAITSTMPGAPVYRLICGDEWFHIDGASGALLARLDRSGRTYRWLYGGLHTLDVPFLRPRPALRTALVVTLCGLGLAFSLTGVVIGWRRLRLQFSART
jgi:hypothetical protein